MWRIALGTAACPSASGACAIAAARSDLPRRDAHDVAAREREPQIAIRTPSTPDTVAANAIALPVGELLADAHDLARPTIALAETAKSKASTANPASRKRVANRSVPQLLGQRRPAGHDHAAALRPWVTGEHATREPPGAGAAGAA
jgi:hypothetical protein